MPAPLPPRVWRVGTLTYRTGQLASVLAWLLGGDFALAMRDRAIPQVMQLLFRRFGASDTLVGLLFTSLPSAAGLLAAPVAGYRSDRLRTRLGRRIPFLLATTPLIVGSMAGMAACAPLGTLADRLLGAHSPGAAACSLAVLSLFWALFELGCIVANLVFQGLVNDVIPPEAVGRAMGLLRAFSLGAGIFFFYWGMGNAEAHYAALFVGIAVLYAVGFLGMCLRVREGEYPPPPHAPRRGLAASVAAYFRDSFRHGYYRLYFAFVVLASLGPAAFNLFSVFYAKSLGMGMGAYGKCYALTFLVSLVLAYPLGILADRLHPLRLTLASLILYAVAMAAGAVAVHGERSFAALLIVHGVLSGVFYTASASLGQRLLPRAKFTELSSAAGVSVSLANMAFAPLLGLFLDRTAHDYRHTFHVGLAVTGAAVVAGLLLYRRFLSLGGPRAYRAPGEAAGEAT